MTEQAVRLGEIGPTPGKTFPTAPMYASRSSDAPLVDLAFWGRVSDEDLQDPTLSIPRQLANCQAALPPGARIVAHYWDIESGRIDPDRRGRSRRHERFEVAVPRDGGIRDLLDAAAGRHCAFDAVICESIDRVARRTYYGVKIEHDLERAGLTLLAADEGISNLRKRATAILTRRVKQATSEWYVLETLEKAWDGFCEHTTQGWNIGVPPYGYVGDRIRHPVPAKRAEGLTKTRLVLDPVRAPVVAEMFERRVGERLSWQAIANRLNTDLDRYPPPVPIGGVRSRGSWSALSVRSILANPKYTGHMVWNRRSRESKFGSYNSPELWVWSPEPTHPAIVSLELFRAVGAVTAGRRRSRSGSEPNRHPETERTYVLRSFVHCGICHHRMEGSTRKGRFVYFRCRPRPIRGRDPFALWPDHPADVYVAQDELLAGVLDFYAERVFGRDRSDLLSVDLDRTDVDRQAAWESRAAALERTVTELATRRERLLRSLEVTDDPGGVLAQDVSRRLEQLAGEQLAKQDELRELQGTPGPVGGRSVELLDHLGHVTAEQLGTAPEPALRRIFDATALTVRYDPRDRLAECEVTLDDVLLPAVDRAVSAVVSAETTVPEIADDLGRSSDTRPDELGIYCVRSEELESPTF